MREILFRGLRADNQGWVYGMLVHSFEGAHIIESDYFKPSNGQSPELIDIIPETVGQFTGLTDKNGVKLFEGDIFDIHQTVNGIRYFVIVSCIGGYDIRYYYDGKPQRKYEYSISELLDIGKTDKEIEVIGNIYENK